MLDPSRRPMWRCEADPSARRRAHLTWLGIVEAVPFRELPDPDSGTTAASKSSLWGAVAPLRGSDEPAPPVRFSSCGSPFPEVAALSPALSPARAGEVPSIRGYEAVTQRRERAARP